MELDKLLQLIKKRPNMFFREREKTLIHLGVYLSGYFFCRSDSENIKTYENDFKYYFSRFILEKFNEEEVIESWDEYLIKKEDSWNLFFELYEEFRAKPANNYL